MVDDTTAIIGHYYVVNVGWTEYCVKSDYKGLQELERIYQDYPEAQVQIRNDASHEVFYDWQPLSDITGAGKVR